MTIVHFACISEMCSNVEQCVSFTLDTVHILDKNTDSRQTFQVFRRITAACRGKRLTLILLSEICVTSQDYSINVVFNLDDYLWLKAENKSLVRNRERQQEDYLFMSLS